MQESSRMMSSQPVECFLRRAGLSRVGLRTVVVAATLVMTSCAGSELSGKIPEQVVEQRAQHRLDALMAGDINKAMAYTTPAYRARVTPAHYSSRFAGVGSWTEARVSQVRCEEERCNVRVQVSYQLPRPSITNTRPLDETWIKVDGRWYIHHQ